MKARWRLTAGLVLLLTVTANATGNGVVYDAYKTLPDGTSIPDVNKPGNRGVDNSCWQAVAANLLGASGYGIGAGPLATPQQRADHIYNQLNTDLGILQFGSPQNAINYWLYTYGKNPNSAEFLPNNVRTDVTWFFNPAGLTSVQYDFLLDELNRCQYVGVTWDVPAHAMTLIGGNKSNALPANNVSIWHDSDKTVGNGPRPSDDLYHNMFTPVWNMDDPANPGPPLEYQVAQGYVTLCPGLNKPESAVRNYDVAYFRTDADNQDGTWTPVFREAGTKAATYVDPQWDQNAVTNPTAIIGNEVIPFQQKEVYLLVDYTDRVAGRAGAETVKLQVTNPGNGQVLTLDPTLVTASTDDGQLLFTWILDFQPGSESIIFPDTRYQLLTGNVKDWDVATICVPEPAVWALLALAGAWVLPLRRARQ